MSRSIINYPKDARIVMEGMQNPGYIYVVVSGEILIESKVQFINKNLNRYKVGDVFGFVSALLKKNHHDTLIAHTECQVIRLTVEDFIEYMIQNPDFFRKFLTHNSEKLRLFLKNIDTFGTEFLDPNRYPEALFQIGKEYLELENRNIGSYAIKKYLTLDFHNSKNPKSVQEAEALLKKINPKYDFPILEEYVDGSGIVYKKGDVIFVENEPEDFLYVIAEGSVRISKLVNKRDLLLEVIRKGEIFGEMAILNKTGRSATAIANEDSKLLRLTVDDLFQKSNSIVLSRLFYLLAKRFWLASQRFYIRQIEDKNVKLYMQLQILAEDALLKNQNKKKELEIHLGTRDLGDMLGLLNMDKSEVKDFFSDPNIRIKPDRILINNYEDLEFKVSVMQKKYRREMGEILL